MSSYARTFTVIRAHVYRPHAYAYRTSTALTPSPLSTRFTPTTHVHRPRCSRTHRPRAYACRGLNAHTPFPVPMHFTSSTRVHLVWCLCISLIVRTYNRPRSRTPSFFHTQTVPGAHVNLSLRHKKIVHGAHAPDPPAFIYRPPRAHIPSQKRTNITRTHITPRSHLHCAPRKRML